MALEARRHGFTFLVMGAVVLFLTTLYFPNLYQNSAYYFELTWFVLLPVGLVFFVLGVFRLLVNAALELSEKLKKPLG